ncbi:MAG: ribosome maturation factor RimP [Acidobacteria bacterium]|nr:ribosome maturation factor RimP [Acidobacteriota bacterium]
MRQDLIDKIWAIAGRVTRSDDMEVVDVEFLGGGRHRVVRIYIDKAGGVSLADCENVSTQVGTILDVEDVIPGGEYTLEVSSPGVERKLVRPSDFERFTGQRVKIVCKEPVEGSASWDGVLEAFSDQTATVAGTKGRTVKIPFDKIKKANLKFEW